MVEPEYMEAFPVNLTVVYDSCFDYWAENVSRTQSKDELGH